jgi:hypothetical protein
MSTKRVYVYDDGSGELRVWPIARVVKRGNEVEIVNTTDSEVRWRHAESTVYGEPIDENIKKQKRGPKTKVKGKGPKTVSYQVDSVPSSRTSGKRRKRDSSDPVIIIET